MSALVFLCQVTLSNVQLGQSLIFNRIGRECGGAWDWADVQSTLAILSNSWFLLMMHKSHFQYTAV